MDTQALLKKVRKIEIKTKGLSKHWFTGEYQSAFKGRGMSFSEVRDYQAGDDVRHIDWNVTARSNSPFIKVFEEERELTVMLLIDISPSSLFGVVSQTKNEIMAEIAAVLAFSAINNNDKVGVLLFSDQVELFIPPKKGRQHILRIIREIIQHESKGTGTDISQAIRYFNNLVKKRSICFVLSDFQDKNYDKELLLAARKHDMVGIHIFDPREANLPNVGVIRACDPETGLESWIDTTSSTLRNGYKDRFEKHLQNSKIRFSRSGADLLSIATNEPYDIALHQFFKKRGA